MPFSRMLAAKSGKVIELQRYIAINAKYLRLHNHSVTFQWIGFQSVFLKIACFFVFFLKKTRFILMK